jgi:AcrR family transcriptional regulator
MRKGDLTRRNIIETAMSLFLEKGAHSISLQEVSRSAGVAQPTIYNHFKNKDEILLACCAAAVEAGRQYIDARIDPRDSARKRLSAYVEGNFEWVKKQRMEANAWLGLHYFGSSIANIRKLAEQVDQGSIARIEEHVIQGVREGVWNVKFPANCARNIHSLLIGEMLKAFYRPSEFSGKVRLERVMRGVWALLERS